MKNKQQIIDHIAQEVQNRFEKAMVRSRHQFMEQFLKRFFEEWEGML